MARGAGDASDARPFTNLASPNGDVSTTPVDRVSKNHWTVTSKTYVELGESMCDERTTASLSPKPAESSTVPLPADSFLRCAFALVLQHGIEALELLLQRVALLRHLKKKQFWVLVSGPPRPRDQAYF